MCVVAYVNGKCCETVGELKQALPVVKPDAGEELDADHNCLCCVNIEYSCLSSGYHFERDECGDWYIWNGKKGEA